LNKYQQELLSFILVHYLTDFYGALTSTYLDIQPKANLALRRIILPLMQVVPAATGCATALPWSQMPKEAVLKQMIEPSVEQAWSMPEPEPEPAPGVAVGIGITTREVGEATTTDVVVGAVDDRGAAETLAVGEETDVPVAEPLPLPLPPSKTGTPSALGQLPSLPGAGCSSTFPNLPGFGIFSTPLPVVHSPGTFAMKISGNP
jgi:hypothetical protein